MSFYENKVLPHLIELACSGNPINKQREKVVPHAEGRVLEIGMGSGLNIPFYNAEKVELLWGLEPSAGMRSKLKTLADTAPFELRILPLPGEEIPLDDDSVDTIVLTYTLCSIPDWETALRQMRRVLKPGGKLLFSEHGKTPDVVINKWQDRINPYWKKISGGCHLNRDIPHLLEQEGFDIKQVNSMYVPSLIKIASFTYWGYAV